MGTDTSRNRSVEVIHLGFWFCTNISLRRSYLSRVPYGHSAAYPRFATLGALCSYSEFLEIAHDQGSGSSTSAARSKRRGGGGRVVATAKAGRSSRSPKGRGSVARGSHRTARTRSADPGTVRCDLVHTLNSSMCGIMFYGMPSRLPGL